MDIVSSASAVVGLVFNLAKLIKTCNDIRGRYKNSNRTVECIRHELETLQGALQELASLMMHDASALSSRWDSNKTLPRTFSRAINGFGRTIEDLQKSLDLLQPLEEKLRKGDKIRLLWNEDGMKEHLGQLRAQSNALQLLLLVLQTGGVSEIKKHLGKVEIILGQLSNFTSNPRTETNSLDIFKDEEDLICFNQESGWDGTKYGKFALSQTAVLEATFVINEDDHLEKDQESADGPSDDRSESNPSEPELPGDLDILSSQGKCNKTGHSGITLRVVSENESTPIRSPISKPDSSESSHTSSHSNNGNRSERIPEIIQAVLSGREDEVTRLLDDGHDVNVRHPITRKTPLMYAAYLNFSAILGLLIERGADIALVDGESWTAVHFAASEGSLACMELLISMNIALTAPDYFHETPLHHATKLGRGEIVKTLLPFYPNLVQWTNSDQRNVFHLAAMFDRVEMFDLVDTYMKPTLPESQLSCEDPKNPPMKTIHTYPEIKRALDEPDVYGCTPFQLAVLGQANEAVSAILRLTTTNINNPIYVIYEDRDKRSWTTALHLATQSSNLDLIIALLVKGANVNSVNSFDKTPICWALELELELITKCLLSHGAEFHGFPKINRSGSKLDPDFSNRVLDLIKTSIGTNTIVAAQGKHILREAQIRGRWDIVKELIGRGEHPKTILGAILEEQRTIQQALDSATVETMEFLLQHGAYPNGKIMGTCGTQWYLPIHLAAHNGRIDMIQVLMRYGSDLLSKDSSNNLSTFSYAATSGNIEMVVFIFEELFKYRFPDVVTRKRRIEEALFEACRGVLDRGGTNMVEMLRIVVGLCEQELGQTTRLKEMILAKAVRYGRIEAVKLVIQHVSLTTYVMDKIKFRLQSNESFEPNNEADFESCKDLVWAAREKQQRSSESQFQWGPNQKMSSSNAQEEEKDTKRSSKTSRLWGGLR